VYLLERILALRALIAAAMADVGAGWRRTGGCVESAVGVVLVEPQALESRMRAKIYFGADPRFLGGISALQLRALRFGLSDRCNRRMPDMDCIREQLAMYPGSKLGFVIYRLTYSDDVQWARFMSHLNTRVQLGLEVDGDGDVFAHVDWTVQEDPELDEALYETDDALYATLRE
jgi:hypothetical protein